MYFGFKSFVRYMYCDYFTRWYLSIHFLQGIFWQTKMFNFDSVQLISF